MRIKRVEVQGFKSFPDRVTMDFSNGIIAVVGPNGCGKSNVVDAIRWVLGEQSAKHLRGKAMEDVIFHGSQDRSAVGMSEVSLIFSNDNGDVTQEYADYSEIMVSRRLFRSGESEYSINKTPCRLRDVLEFFMDTGVGVKAYSIVEQGHIARLASINAEERRTLLEEAAGIMKYKSRKRAALRKIELTEINMSTIENVTAEVRRQMNSLKRQAKQAERFQEYETEIRDIDLRIEGARYIDVGCRLNELHESLTSKSDEELALTTESKEQEAENESLRAELIEEEKGLHSLQERIIGIKGTIGKKESEEQYYKRELNENRDRRERIESDITKYREQISTADARVEVLRSQKEEMQAKIEVESEGLDASEKELETLKARYEAGMDEVERKKGDLVGILTDLAQADNTIYHEERRLEEITEKIERDRGDRVDRQQESDRMSAAVNGYSENYLSGLRNYNLFQRKKTGLVAALDRLKERVAEKGAFERRLDSEIQEAMSRCQSLREIQDNFEGLQHGVRSIMTRERGSDEGENQKALALVADVVEVEPGLERAVEAVLGERIQYIIVKNLDEGVEEIEYLKDKSFGWGSFVPLNQLRVTDREDPRAVAIPLPSLLGRVKAKEGYDRVAGYLFGDVYLAQSLKEGLSLWNRNGWDGTIVTPEGDIIDRFGVISGGSPERLGTGLLKRKRELRDLEASLKKMKKSYSSARNELQAAQDESSDLIGQLERVEKRMQAIDRHIRDQQREFFRAKAELRAIGHRVDLLEFNLGISTGHRDELKVSLEEAKEQRDSLAARKESLGSELESLKEEMDLLWSRSEELNAGVTAMRISKSTLVEKINGVNEEKRLTCELIQEAENNIAVAVEDEKRGADRSEELQRLIKENTLEIEKLVQEQDVVDEKRKTISNIIETKAGSLQGIEEKIKHLSRKISGIHEEINQLNIEVAQRELERSHIVEGIMKRHDINIDEVLETLDLDEYNPDVDSERLAVLTKKKERLGQVNLMAIDEHERLSERYSFLCKQREDLEKSIDQMKHVIQKINRTSRRRFKETYEDVNEKFKEIFPMLFDGGRGELVLNNPDDLLETGLDIVASPAGKKMRNVDLFSGGEKALISMAFIFALIKYKPSPFCLLDEVDAPLDDTNIHRFNELVKEMAKDSQFILITHNKKTMEIADTLYGVTMGEPGISKIVSVRMDH
ncbi:chromosome segregation protein SMC [Thermodesulfobacteriota bacterium]